MGREDNFPTAGLVAGTPHPAVGGGVNRKETFLTFGSLEPHMEY
jgi:hypothetical protein